jgi:hypothetical protein
MAVSLEVFDYSNNFAKMVDISSPKIVIFVIVFKIYPISKNCIKLLQSSEIVLFVC